MPTVAVNPPKTPVTKGSNGIATATMPNICKMPGPPAPFVPTPLPNIGQSDKSPKDHSTTVKIEGQPVAIRGASFGSTGDIASKGTGGGIVSNNVEGPTKFIGPGSLNVQIEGKNVHLLSDPMMNNCGPSGSPPNAATMMGLIQQPNMVTAPKTQAEEEKCKELAHAVYSQGEVLDNRIADLKKDKLNLFKIAKSAPSPSLPKGTGSWDGHVHQAKGVQNGLRRDVMAYDKAGCDSPKIQKRDRSLAWAQIPTRPDPK